MIICVGSKNPTKVSAVQQVVEAFQWSHAIIESFDVPSGVRPQPLGDEETIQGAINRARSALQAGTGDLGIGLEGGVQETEHGMFLCNWGAVVNESGVIGIGGGARILLPNDVASQIRIGRELSDIMNELTNRENIRSKEGALGIFTNGFITRARMFSDVVACALAPFHHDFYKGDHHAGVEITEDR